MAKPNYRHAKKQKEAARKARQDAKQQRKATLPEVPESADTPSANLPAANLPAAEV